MDGTREIFGLKKNITNAIIIVDQKHAGLITTYRRKKMTDGINLTGFNETGEQSGSNTLDLNPTGQAPASAFPASDKSSQDGAGLGNGGK